MYAELPLPWPKYSIQFKYLQLLISRRSRWSGDPSSVHCPTIDNQWDQYPDHQNEKQHSLYHSSFYSVLSMRHFYDRENPIKAPNSDTLFQYFNDRSLLPLSRSDLRLPDFRVSIIDRSAETTGALINISAGKSSSSAALLHLGAWLAEMISLPSGKTPPRRDHRKACEHPNFVS